MNIPDKLYYSKDHEWILMNGDTATVGITAHAAEQLGDITFIELPEIEMGVSPGSELAVVESIKAASDIFAPVGGVVKEINSELDDSPDKINSDPYGEGWICKISGVDKDDVNKLMSAEKYVVFLNEN